MKKLIPAILVIFFLCFMLFIYEPILMYATNMNDFWFDFRILLKPVFLLFSVSFICFTVILFFVYCINKKFSKDLKVYNVLLLILFTAFFAMYIHGNYLTSFLPNLDGSYIHWSDYTKIGIVSIGIWIFIAAILFFTSRKCTMEKTIQYATYVSIAIFVMLGTSFASIFITKDVLIGKSYDYLTDVNINSISKNKNFLMFLVDATDSSTFQNLLNENEDYKKIFEDFTYYPDTMSSYAYTRDSIPSLLSGGKILNKNEKEFSEYSTNALNQSSLFQKLKEKDYLINMYDTDLIWNTPRNYKIGNIISGNNTDINWQTFIRQETKYLLFKYLPFPLKRFSKIQTMDFNLCIEKYRADNISLNTLFKNEKELQKESMNQFQFIHAEGAHVPYHYDKNINLIENGTYEQNVEASITLIKSYLERLKSNNVYDNSVIIILSDHGFDKEYRSALYRFNPIFLVKGIDEKHEMIESDIPISFEDFQSASEELLNDKKSTELFQNIEKNRTRKMLWYEFTKEDHMVEYETTGYATDVSKFKQTGNVYDR